MNRDLPNDIDIVLHDICTNYVITPESNIYNILTELYGNVKWLSFSDRIKLTTMVALFLNQSSLPNESYVKDDEQVKGKTYTTSSDQRVFFYHPLYLETEFRIIVTDHDSGQLVFEHSGDELVSRGFMRDDNDVEGLRGFLIHIGELLDDDVLKRDSSL